MTKPIQPVLGFARPADDCVELVMARVPPHDLLLVPDIATAMGLSNSVVRNWLEDGRLPSINCGAGEEREFRKVSRNTFRRFLEMRRDGIN
jgi:hypothetical protein